MSFFRWKRRAPFWRRGSPPTSPLYIWSSQDRSFDASKQTKERARRIGERENICRAHLQLKHEGSGVPFDRARFLRTILSRWNSIVDPQNDEINTGPWFRRNFPMSLRHGTHPCAAILAVCTVLRWREHLAHEAEPRRVYTHARPYARSTPQGLVFCFSVYRLPCTQCYLAGTKPATMTPASSGVATPASNRAWRDNAKARI